MGLYAGRNFTSAWRDWTSSEASADLCAFKLSMTKISPGRNCGSKIYLIYSSNILRSTAPSKRMLKAFVSDIQGELELALSEFARTP